MKYKQNFYTNIVKMQVFILLFLWICAKMLNKIKFNYKGGWYINERKDRKDCR